MKSRSVLLALIIAWLIFVVSLTTWWMIFSLSLIDQLNELAQHSDFLRHRQMLLMEGSVLVVLLLIGGAGLIYYSLREKKRFDDVRHFFSTFSHDIKTSITRLVLQGETLSGSEVQSRKLDQFQKNLLALELQLENSMHVAQAPTRGLTLELVDLKSVIGRLHPAWPEVKIQLRGESRLVTDAPAIESILKNLISNSVLHGKADEVQLQVFKSQNHVELQYSDNGKMDLEDVTQLGKSLRPSQKGSGIGLYLLRQWAEKLSGQVEFSQSQTQSLLVKLILPNHPEKA